MPISAINSFYFNTTLKLERRTASKDNTGDLINTWSIVNAALPAIIRPVKVTEKMSGSGNVILFQGKEYKVDKKGYCPVIGWPTVLNGDRATDNETGEIFFVAGVEQQFPARSTLANAHHQKLYLSIYRATKS